MLNKFTLLISILLAYLSVTAQHSTIIDRQITQNITGLIRVCP
jgi:hypothetical protein